jgi:hypothetical protein
MLIVYILNITNNVIFSDYFTKCWIFLKIFKKSFWIIFSPCVRRRFKIYI